MVKNLTGMRTSYRHMLAVLCIGCLSASVAFAQNQAVEQQIRKGNTSYQLSSYAEAAQWYRQALASDLAGKYQQVRLNLGNALFLQAAYDDALEQYNQLIASDAAASFKSAAYYNAGNALLAQKRYAEAIAFYKQCLRLNPEDEDARYNFSLANALLHASQSPAKAPPGPEKEYRPPPVQLDPEKLRDMLKQLQAAEDKTLKNRPPASQSQNLKEKDW